MRLARLEVIDFRNHAGAALDLEPGANLLLGPNGVGKTNLLEAAGYLAMLSSYRASQDAVLVRTGAAAAVIRAAVVRSGPVGAGRRLSLELELRPGTKLRGRLNRSPVPRARDLAGAFRAVVFAPEDLALVRGDPEERRRFLDTLAPQRLPRFLALRHDYDRILRQRNTLLRSAGGRTPPGGGLATLEVWDERLAAAGSEIWAERLRLVGALRPLVAAAYQELAGPGAAGMVELRYTASTLAGDQAGADEEPAAPAELRERLRERWARDRQRELERGLTLTGPHRDDLLVHLNGLPARSHASHGEAWSLALSLRLASHRWLAEDGETPVLLLDDVFAELDRRRRERLAVAAGGVEQVVVTAAVAEEVPGVLRAARFQVRPGAVTRLLPPGEVAAEPDAAGTGEGAVRGPEDAGDGDG